MKAIDRRQIISHYRYPQRKLINLVGFFLKSSGNHKMLLLKFYLDETITLATKFQNILSLNNRELEKRYACILLMAWGRITLMAKRRFKDNLYLRTHITEHHLQSYLADILFCPNAMVCEQFDSI